MMKKVAKSCIKWTKIEEPSSYLIYFLNSLLFELGIWAKILFLPVIKESNVENPKLLKYGRRGLVLDLVSYFRTHKGSFVMHKCKL